MSDASKKRFGILKVLAIAALLILVLIIALPFVLNANRFKPEVETALTNALGRTTTVGNLRLALFSGSIAADEIAIADEPSFAKSPFVRARSLKVGVELMPLIFSRTLHITGIALEKPEIALIRSDSGEWNFSSIGVKPASQPAPKAPAKTSGSSEVAISISRLRIIDGRLTVARREGGTPPYVYEPVHLQARDLSLTTAFPFNLTAGLPGGGTMSLDGKAGPITKADASLTPFVAALVVTQFDLVKSGFIEPGSGIAGLIDFDGSLNSDGRQLQSQGKARVDKLQAAKGGTPAGRPLAMKYAFRHDLKNQTGVLDDTRIELGKAVSQLSCSYDLKGKAPVLKVKLRGENMPIEELKAFLPAAGVTLPEGSSLQGGTLSLDLAGEGPLENLVTQGDIGVFKTRLAGFDLGSKMVTVAKLAGISPNSVTEIEKLTVDARAAQEGIQLNDILLIVPALGQLSGSGIIGSDRSLNLKMLARLNASGGIAGRLASLAGSADGQGLAVPFFIRGTAEKPSFVADMKGTTGGLIDSYLAGRKSKEGAGGQSQSLGDSLRSLLKKKESQKKKETP